MSDRPGPVSTYPLYGSVPAAGRGRKTTRQSCQCIYTHTHIHAYIYIYLNSVVRLFLFFTFQSIPIAFNRCRCLCAFYCRCRCLCLHPSVFFSSFSPSAPLCACCLIRRTSPASVPCQQICAESHQLAGIVSDITRTRS